MRVSPSWPWPYNEQFPQTPSISKLWQKKRCGYGINGKRHFVTWIYTSDNFIGFGNFIEKYSMFCLKRIDSLNIFFADSRIS